MFLIFIMKYSQIEGVNNIDVLEDLSIKIESLELQDLVEFN